MCAWGVKSLECDEGLDIKDRWHNWVDGNNAVGYEASIKRFFERWGDSINYGRF